MDVRVVAVVPAWTFIHNVAASGGRKEWRDPAITARAGGFARAARMRGPAAFARPGGGACCAACLRGPAAQRASGAIGLPCAGPSLRGPLRLSRETAAERGSRGRGYRWRRSGCAGLARSGGAVSRIRAGWAPGRSGMFRGWQAGTTRTAGLLALSDAGRGTSCRSEDGTEISHLLSRSLESFAAAEDDPVAPRGKSRKPEFDLRACG
jgi:hypothetical protein